MKTYSADKIRNIAVMGHTGSGKTAILEACLNIAGATTRIGRVDEGNTVSDYDPEEVRRRISIGSSLIPVEWKDTKINFIDTPGFFDFVGEVRQALSAADVALIVISAKSGIEVGTEKAWDLATECGLPKVILINGIDDENAEFDKICDELVEKFGKCIAPLQAPIKEGGKFTGIVNIVKKQGRKFVDGRTQDIPMPADMADVVEHLHDQLKEAAAETSEEMMERFFEGDEFSIEELYGAVNSGVAEGSVTPVFVCSAVQNLGVRVAMNSLVSFLPPASVLRKSMAAKNAKGEDITVQCNESAPFTAQVFKTISDNFGRLSVFRVNSGILKKETPLHNTTKDAGEKISQIFAIRGKEQIAVSELKTGDIGAIPKLSGTSTGDTLSTKENSVIYAPIAFPPALYSRGIVPKSKGDEDKISQALARFLEEDRTLKFKVDPETKQSVLSGVGDGHLDVIVNRLLARNKLEVELVPLIVPYRETIRGKAENIRGRHKKQSGGAGQFGDVVMTFEPLGDTSKTYEFEQKIFGGSVPRNYWPAVEKGVQESCLAGPLAGYPVVGLKATLLDGSYHAVDSNELSFKLAAILAFKDGFVKAKPAILEPIMKIEILVPDDYTGDIMGDINKRRGRILGMSKEGSKQLINAQAPLSEMLTYSIDLRSITQGRGEFSMEFDSYEEAPQDAADKIIANRKRD